MTGAASAERQVGLHKEATVGTTGTNPAFAKIAADTFNMSAIPRITEVTSIATGGQRSAITRKGTQVTGSMSCKLKHADYDNILESMLQGEWSSDALINGSKQKTFTIEEKIPQGAGASSFSYARYRGCEVTGGALDIQAGGDVILTANFLGTAAGDASSSALAGATYSEPDDGDTFGAGADVGTLTMGSWTLDCIQSLNIQFNYNGRDEQPKIGSNDLCGVSRGGFVPVITGRFYIEDNFINIYNAARAGTDFALSMKVGDTNSEKIKFDFFSCEFVGAPLVTQESGPAFQDFTIMPKYKSGSGFNGIMKITRKTS